MSAIDTMNRIAEVRLLIGEVRAPAAPAPAPSAAAAAGGEDFAAVLARAGLAAPTAPAPAAPALPALPPGAASAGGQAVVAGAQRYLGIPYVFGGEDTTGMDCSGLVQRVFADLGVEVPRVVVDQARVGVEVPSLAEAQPGDLIVTRDRGHIVIYAGDGMIIHAPRPGKNVELVPNYLTQGDIGTIRRIIPGGGA
ncbi:C40 family peptidase [Microcella daejeonensis]|uniref:C40 family peptidase n=1 Tax=Microcella daejeonensis TaxID=2994971 RepID=A0A9E8MLC9_9MICO|nr:C40 family peptidase [Microcella daejeonensis]WAB81733.1 C40 family peptidase [Microcella daejeonensis]